ncbi:MAG: 23S rRNA (pseudouridine(1915)-N(3))-methyltransferase RlmH [Erysipelotrichales bacterium]|nr:23S rRNA (pseudouridine(1915)-N(3))-methyltransferase RlmH [Erysipelotrichales bacterium]
MMTIRIIAVGKIKETYLQEGIQDFQKRINKYAKLEIIEVKDSASDDEKKAKKEEAERIEGSLKNGYNIILAIEGETLSSPKLSAKIDEIATYHNPVINFIIGGSHGLCQTIIDKANYSLSFSRLTFPHQLMRLLLLEQLFRAFKILSNEVYHK